MRVFLCVLILIIGFFLYKSPTTQAADDEELIVAVIDWCPQICPKSPSKGYIIDIVEDLFKDSPYKLKFHFAPWSRVIQMTRSGKAIALLSPAKAEAPDLIYPNMEVGSQRMCFFTGVNTEWSYDGIASLKGRLTGVARDTSLPGLNDYINLHKEEFHVQPYSPTYLENSLQMLDSGRLDSFLFTQNTARYEISKMGRNEDYKTVGCLEKEKVYMAFSPARHLTQKVNEVLDFFDERMSNYLSQNRHHKLMTKYDISDPFQ